ncbi:DNA-binding protein [Arachis hypogaea]|nr:DNA-binding protein [Arachis hypogaea]
MTSYSWSHNLMYMKLKLWLKVICIYQIEAFISDEEAGKMPKGTQTDQNEHAKEQTHSKSKGKGDKKIGAEKKRGRSTGGKPQPKTVKKIAPKKAPNSKKAKTKN